MTSDTARCNGVGSIEDGVQYWREGCEICLRRTAPRPKRVVMIEPPDIIAFECEYLIERKAERRRGERRRTTLKRNPGVLSSAGLDSV